MADKLVVFLPGFGNVEIPLIDFDPKRKPLLSLAEVAYDPI